MFFWRQGILKPMDLKLKFNSFMLDIIHVCFESITDLLCYGLFFFFPLLPDESQDKYSVFWLTNILCLLEESTILV